MSDVDRFRVLDAATLVSGQIGPSDMAALKARGVAMIVNNRPDGEEPGQPSGADIEAAALAAGIGYRHVPVDNAGLSPDRIAAMAEAIEASGGRMLAFCRSGTRSTYLWALARARAGEDAGELIAKAAAAGYDISPIRPHLR